MLRDVLIQKGLSNRESEVAGLVTKGLSNKEVANQLFVTEKTVKFHLTNIYKKMQVKSRAQLIVWCLPHMDFITNDTVQASAQPVAAINANTGMNVQTMPIGNATAANTIPAGNTTVGDSLGINEIPVGRSNDIDNTGGGNDAGSSSSF